MTDYSLLENKKPEIYRILAKTAANYVTGRVLYDALGDKKADKETPKRELEKLLSENDIKENPDEFAIGLVNYIMTNRF